MLVLSLMSAHAAELLDEDAVAPDFALRTLDGDNFRLSEQRGNVVLLGFWARWCGDCRQSMAALNEIHAKYKTAGLVVWGINVDEREDQARAMAASLALAFPVLLDNNRSVSGQFNLKAMPTLILIDREGRIRFTHSGFERGQQQLIAEHLRQLLNE